MTILFDGTNHPTAAQVKAAGCSGAALYGGTPQYAKNFTAAQYADYKANGLMTLFVFEVDTNDMAGGFNAGSAHARALLADLRAKGVADTEPVGATVDKHVTAADIPLAVQYQNGFWSAVRASGWRGAVGGYGFSEFLIAIHNAGIADWYWGAGARSSMPPYTNIWQDNTGTIQVGGSADDRDWVLIPLPGGVTMDWSDQIPFNQTPANPARTAPAGQCLANADLYAGNAMNNTAVLLQDTAAIKAQLATLGGALAADEAAILGAVQGVDGDLKAGITQLITAFAAPAVNVKAFAAALAPALAALLPAETPPAVLGEAVVAALEAHLAATPPTGGTP